jgi:hypothetical protein
MEGPGFADLILALFIFLLAPKKDSQGRLLGVWIRVPIRAALITNKLVSCPAASTIKGLGKNIRVWFNSGAV